MTTVYAAIYTRISNDPEGRELGVERQLQDCQAYAARHGYCIVDVYTDNDISASAIAKKTRPRYRQLLADAVAGRFQVIIAYTSSRLTRQIREALDLIDLAKSHKVKYDYLRSPKHDLNTARGRIDAKKEAVDNEGEPDIISERVARDVLRRAQQGEFHGGPVPFGIEAEWGMVRRQQKIIAFRVNEQQKALILEAARRVLSTETTYGICKDWNKKGRTTPAGARWSQRYLNRILTNPGTAGIRYFQGETLPTPWPAILDRTDHERLVQVLTDPSRKTSSENKRKYMLSGLVHCALCKATMVSTSTKPSAPAGFECSKNKSGKAGCGRVRVEMAGLEKYVLEQFFFTLDSPAFSTAMSATREDASEAEAMARREVQKWEMALFNLEEEKDDPDVGLSLADYKRRRASITVKLDAGRQAFSLATRSVVHASLPPVDELKQKWPNEDNTWRRTIVSAVIERIDVSPHPRGVPSSLPRLSKETLEAWHARHHEHRMDVMDQRVDIQWYG